MGSWGVGPTENDDAADLAFDLREKTIYEVVEEGLNSDDVHEQRFGAWLVARLGYPQLYDIQQVRVHVDLALDKMRELLENKNWIGCWENEKKIREAIQKQIDELTRVGC